jgi:transcriptional regulator with XRE-family HTH domain
MYSNPQKLSMDDSARLRRDAGHWLKELREARGLSQRQLAAEVGVEYYTFISQLESGRGRIPPDRYRVWAEALGVSPRHFVAKLMQFYDPVTYAILFDDSVGKMVGNGLRVSTEALVPA